jgi:hypothetical protein
MDMGRLATAQRATKMVSPLVMANALAIDKVKYFRDILKNMANEGLSRESLLSTAFRSQPEIELP